MNQKTKALLYLHIAVFLWGFTGVLGKLIVLNALPLVWIRMLVCSIIILPFTIKTICSHSANHKKQIFYAFGVGAILALHWLFFYGSLKLSTVSVAVVCLSATAFFTVFIEYFSHQKKILLRNLLLSLIAVMGIGLMFELETQYRWGIIAGILASVLNAFIPIFNKPIISFLKPLPTLAIEMFAGFLMLSIFLFFENKNIATQLQLIDGTQLFYILLLAIVCTLIPMYLAYDALQFISPFTENIIVNLEPVYTVIIAFYLFNEGALIGFGFYLGIAFILISVLFQSYFDYSEKKNARKYE